MPRLGQVAVVFPVVAANADHFAPSLACPRGVGILSGGSGHEVPPGAQLTRP
jgi:hypothetical protein